jgi:hypothetical protein
MQGLLTHFPALCIIDGGVNIDSARLFFGYLLGNGTFPNPAYFSLDTLDALYLPNLDAMVTSLLELVTNTANSDSVTQLVYDSDKGSTFDQADVMNAIALIDVLLAESQKVIPSPTNLIFMQFLTEYREQAVAVADATDFSDPAIQYAVLDIAGSALFLTVIMDFFNPSYPKGEAYMDQTFDNETMTGAPAEPTSGAPDWSTRTFAWLLVTGIGTVLCYSS